MDLIMKRLAMFCLVLFGTVAVIQGVPAPGRGALEGYRNKDWYCKPWEFCLIPGVDDPIPPSGDVRRFVAQNANK